MDTKRVILIDILKSIGIACIIFTHLPIYLRPNDIWTMSDISNIGIPGLGLSCFFFASAYTISKYDDFSTNEKIETFLWRRAKRIYPLYWFAIFVYIIVFGFMHITHDINHIQIIDYIFHFLGVQQIGVGSIYTTQEIPYLWFVGVILFFYFLYIFIVKYATSNFEILRNSLLIYIAMFLVSFNDFRMYAYFPVFISGVFVGRTRVIDRFSTYTSKIPNRLASTFKYIAYSSYAVYLLHGPFLSLMESINHSFGLTGVADVLCLVGVYIPILFLICHYIQQIADGKLKINFTLVHLINRKRKTKINQLK